MWPDGAVHEAADRFLRGYDGSGTQRTYAYLLVDHLRWLEREALTPQTASLQDLKRYMAAAGAAWRGAGGQPWRRGPRPTRPGRPGAARAWGVGGGLRVSALGCGRRWPPPWAPAALGGRRRAARPRGGGRPLPP